MGSSSEEVSSEGVSADSSEEPSTEDSADSSTEGSEGITEEADPENEELSAVISSCSQAEKAAKRSTVKKSGMMILKVFLRWCIV
jgi:hypothetical protein